MEKSKDYYIYVLYCADDSLYCGFTDNVARRFAAHQEFRGAKYTKVKSATRCGWFIASALAASTTHSVQNTTSNTIPGKRNCFTCRTTGSTWLPSCGHGNLTD